VLIGALGIVHAQITTGTVKGSVTDPQNLPIVGAAVSLVSGATGDVRNTKTDARGDFLFAAVPVGEYSIKVVADGFRTLQRPGLALSSNQVLSVGKMELTIGSPAETITVAAEAATIQTASSDISSQIGTTQLETAVIRGRDPVSLLQMMPGVASRGEITDLGGGVGTSLPAMGGVQGKLGRVAIDGENVTDANIGTGFVGPTAIDFINEVQIMANNFQAEYGGNLGGNIKIISKSGTKEFHGSASWFVRNEILNANDFFNNRSGIENPLYRYNTGTASLGGPIYIPRMFNTDRTKLFFFYGFELWRIQKPYALWSDTMPTALQRTGDFSQTLDVSGKQVKILDPTGTQYTGNKIPPSLLNPYGVAFLNLLPLPNRLDRSQTLGQYNYQYLAMTQCRSACTKSKLTTSPQALTALRCRIIIGFRRMTDIGQAA
jgi:hypothetical protein